MFDAYVAYHARHRPRAIAVVTPERQVSYADFDADIDRLGAAITDLGVTPERGVVSLAISHRYLQYVALVAMARLRIVSTTDHDDQADLRLSDTVHPQDAAPETLHLSGDWLSAALAAPRRVLPNLPRDPDAATRVMLSSGTTRTPRRCVIPWRRLDAVIRCTVAHHGAGKLGAWMPVTGVDSLMGYGIVATAWTVGAATVNGLELEDIPAWMDTLDSGVIGLTPAKLSQIVASLPERATPKPQWRIVVGGAPLPPGLAREVRLRLTPDLNVNYGATEASINGFGFTHDIDLHPGLVGHIPPGCEIQILDEEGRQLPPGQQGEIRIRSDRMATGYIDDPQATAERFRDGWFHPGDLGHILPPNPDGSPDGRLVIDGRLDDRMIVGSMKVMPQVLEDAALALPGVKDAAAFAAPDAAGIDQCWLAIVPGPDLDRGALPPHMAARPGVPAHRIAWIDEIPRNTMGKIERARLRDILLAALGSGTG